VSDAEQPTFWLREPITAGDAYELAVSRVLHAERSAFQDIMVVETPTYGRALVLDGHVQTAEGDEFLYHEPIVHVPMCSFALATGRPARRVLILGGGDGGAAREALKWSSVERVVVVDIDGAVVDIAKRWLPTVHGGSFDDPRCEAVVGDALGFVETSDAGVWDVVVSDLSDPIEGGPSFALFTREHFASVRRAMAADGVYAIQAGPIGPAELTLHARICSTLRAAWRSNGAEPDGNGDNDNGDGGSTSSFTSWIPTYGSPLGFAMASRARLARTPDPSRIDALLDQHVRGELRMFDGRAMLGLLSLPTFVREAIGRETVVYALDDPPRAFGRSGVGN
jgi:spermidine synthase